MNTTDEPIDWVHRLAGGDETVVALLWDRYQKRMLGLARKRLGDAPCREADEEDVALSAFDSFCRGVEHGRFAHLTNLDDLWHLLATITVRKVADLRAHQCRIRRGAGKVRGESAFGGTEGSSHEEPGLNQVPDPDPTPSTAAMLNEQCRVLLDGLPSEVLRTVALRKLEGYSNAEIATTLGCSLATVERKLALIRTIWGAAPESSN